MSNKKILWICLAILVGGIIVTALIFSTEPEAKREGASIETAMLVDVLPVEQGTFEPIIVATGTVQPTEDVVLSPLVSGQVIRRDPAFTPGGVRKKRRSPIADRPFRLSKYPGTAKERINAIPNHIGNRNGTPTNC